MRPFRKIYSTNQSKPLVYNSYLKRFKEACQLCGMGSQENPSNRSKLKKKKKKKKSNVLARFIRAPI